MSQSNLPQVQLLLADDGPGRIHADMGASFGFSFWIAEELEDLVALWAHRASPNAARSEVRGGIGCLHEPMPLDSEMDASTFEMDATEFLDQFEFGVEEDLDDEGFDHSEFESDEPEFGEPN